MKTSENKETNIQVQLKHTGDVEDGSKGNEHEIHHEPTTSGVKTDVGNMSSTFDTDSMTDSDVTNQGSDDGNRRRAQAAKHEYEKLMHMTDSNLMFQAIPVTASKRNGKKKRKKMDLSSREKKASRTKAEGRGVQNRAKMNIEGSLLGYEKMEWLDGYVNRDVGNMKVQNAASSHQKHTQHPTLTDTEDSSKLSLEIQKGWKPTPATRKLDRKKKKKQIQNS